MDVGTLPAVATPGKGLYACNQFIKNERLYKVIIRPCMKAGYAVFHGIFRGKYEDVAIGAIFAEALADCSTAGRLNP